MAISQSGYNISNTNITHFTFLMFQVKDISPLDTYSNADFEDAFDKMARSAGVSELSEIIERFR